MSDPLKAAAAGKMLGLSARKMYALAQSGDSFTPEEISAMAPSSILLRAYFHEHLGTPLNGITEFDIEMAQLSYDIERKWREEERKARGEPTAEQRYSKHLAEKLAARHNAQSGKRRSAKLNRTPAWADKKAIQAIYDEARRLTIATGVVHHVDHALPLLGRLVSGLHVETNLQILTGPENCRKRNHFEIEP